MGTGLRGGITADVIVSASVIVVVVEDLLVELVVDVRVVDLKPVIG